MNSSRALHAYCHAAGAVLFLTYAVLTAFPASGHAQIIEGRPSLIRQQFTYLAWSLEGDSTDVTITQWYIPILVSASIAPNWELSLQSAVSGSDADWDVAGDEFSGPSDSRIQLAHALAKDRLLISAGISVPTGQTELTQANRSLLPWLTADYFNFPLKYPGEGLNLFGQLAAATAAGSWVLGAGAAIHYAGEYRPFDDGREYQPGSRFVLTGSAAQDWNGKGHLSIDASVVFSSADKSNGEAIFTDGTLFDLRLSGFRQSTRGRIEASCRAILRGKNKLLDPESLDLALEENNTNGSDLRISLLGRRTFGGRVDGWLSVDARFLAANGYEPGNPLYEDAASLAGVGGGIDVRIGSRSSAGLGVRFWRGASDGSTTLEPLDLSGVEIIQRITMAI